MNILDGTSSWISQCKHIGEAKLFGYILSTFNRTDGSWTNTSQKRMAVEQLLHIKQATQFNYLKSMTQSGLLVKMSRGEYHVNREYIEFGGTTKPEKTQ